MWLSLVPENGKRIIILQCHIFPPSSVDSQKATGSSPALRTIFLSFFHWGAVCIRAPRFMTCHQWGLPLVFICFLTDAKLGASSQASQRNESAVERMVPAKWFLKMESKDSGCYPWVTWQGLSSLIADEHVI